MVDYGLDYSYARPSPAAIKAAGYVFVNRYLSWLPNGKCISSNEYRTLLSNGIDVHLNWEYTAKDALGGASAGRIHAIEAVRQAKALGYPKGATIYFSADFDVTAAQQPTVNAYFRAVKAVLHANSFRCGGYGGYWVVKRLFDALAIDDGWQTYAWSGGLWDGRAHLRQIRNGIKVGEGDVDKNQRIGRTYSAKHPAGLTPPVVPPKVSPKGPSLHRKWPTWMPENQYFGNIAGPSASHGGFYTKEQPEVKAIQQRLIDMRFVPGVTNRNDKFANGRFTLATQQAVERFQRARLPKTTRFGEVWHDDWNKLFTY